MNEQRIELDTVFPVPGTLVMAITPTCFNEMIRQGMQQGTALELLRGLSTCQRLLLIYTKRGITLYLRQGNFWARLGNDNTLLLTKFQRNDMRANNDCLRMGISVCCTGGILMNVTIKEGYQLKLVFQNGKQYDWNRAGSQGERIPTAVSNGADVVRLLEAKSMERGNGRRPRAEAAAVRVVPPQLEEYLDLAEAYAAGANELEVAKAQQVAPAICWQPRAAHSFARQDRMAYTFNINGAEQDAFAQNAKVQLELEDGAILTATVLEQREEDGQQTVTLLFDDQISVKQLPASAQLRPSYSNIQYTVQHDVVEALRQGSSPAAYMDGVLGGYHTRGFTKKDLRGLDAALQSKKYPPNASQVEAIHRGIETEDILLVLGPPGTGKTTVILEWVKYFIKQEHKRVLVSSQNNKAVDNVLERLTQERDISAIRAGNEAKVQASMYPYLLENRLKDLRAGMEQGTAARLQGLAALRGGCEEYAATIQQITRGRQETDLQETALEQAVQKDYGELCAGLHALQGQRDDLNRQLKRLTAGIRMREFWMMDPEKHPILRVLLTPLRGLLRSSLDRTLTEYGVCLRSLETNKQKASEQLDQLSGWRSNAPLLARAEALLQQQKEQNARENALAQPPQVDTMGCPEVHWPSKQPPFTGAELQELTAMTGRCIAWADAMAAALRGWQSSVAQQNNYALSDLLMASVDLVGGTCIGVNSQKKFARVQFDVTIIDESGQITLHNALVPMSRSPKVIMLGDHLQIPPVADEEQVALCLENDVDPSLLSTSLFQRLYENLPEQNKILLDTQYRMPAQIADLLSEWFYNNKYKSFVGKRNMPGVCPALFRAPFVVVDTGAEPNRGEYKPEMGAGNKLEAAIVAEMLRYMLADGRFTPADFGIISPYGEQVSAIRKAIARRVPGLDKEVLTDMVASLDSFQGQERKIILYSCTRSNRRPPAASRIGFLKELRRLNVALSRPLEQLVFIGDIPFLSGCGNGEGTGSEKDFSAFIRLMTQRVQENGELLSAQTLRERLGVEKYE